ncbi:MAG: signal peptide peptidase SppA [Verrucomicrobia bacterium]|jgi:protease-4|nr:signal peptide peptidase SppA [Verrucomicrobiota bacterium]
MESNHVPDTAVPPPLTPPPVIAPQPAKPVKRKGRGWMVAALILLLLLAVSVVANFGLLIGNALPWQPAGAHSGAPKLQEVVVEDNDARDKVAVIEVEGIITSQLLDGRHNMVDVVEAKLRHAGEDSHVVAVLLKVDSPGGEVLASDDIYRKIQEFQSEYDIPVIASMGGLAASGGYYVSAPCDWIVANDLTITGSIGVILSTWNYRGLMDKVGLVPQTYKSGRHKDMLSGSRNPAEIPPEERAMLQGLIDEVYAKFKNIVKEGRTAAYEHNDGEGRPLVEDWAQYADGRVLSGTEAYKLGFVDEIGTFDQAIDRALELGGVSSANVVRYQHIPDISSLFRLFGEARAQSVRIDLGLDLPKLEPGRMYFLSPDLMQ